MFFISTGNRGWLAVQCAALRNTDKTYYLKSMNGNAVVVVTLTPEELEAELNELFSKEIVQMLINSLDKSWV